MEILEITLPIVVMIGLGAFLNRRHIVSAEGMAGVKSLVSRVMLPVVLFNAVMTTTFTASSFAITAVAFALMCAQMAVGYACRGWLGSYGKYLPFLVSSVEGGMLCYPLYMSLYGSESLSTIMPVDLANIFFSFTVFLSLITMTSKGTADKGEMVRSSLTNPCLDAVALGLLMSLTGLGHALIGSPVGELYSDVVSMVTGPITALVMLIVGYQLSLDPQILTPVLKTSALRIALGVAAIAVLLVPFGGLITTQPLRVGVMLYFLMPTQFVTMVYIDDPDDGAFVSTQISLHSIISIAAFIGIASLVPRA